MKSILAISALLFCANTANAQMTTTTAFAPPPSAFADQTVRVTAPFRVALPPPEEGQPPRDAIFESARHSLYRMAEAECASLSEIYKAECRLNNLNINTYGSTVAATTPGTLSTIAPLATAMTATAVYELRIKGR